MDSKGTGRLGNLFHILRKSCYIDEKISGIAVWLMGEAEKRDKQGLELIVSFKSLPRYITRTEEEIVLKEHPEWANIVEKAVDYIKSNEAGILTHNENGSWEYNPIIPVSKPQPKRKPVPYIPQKTKET